MAFFELRQYRMRPGQRDAWVAFMEQEVIPFQTSKGMVISGTFVGEEDPDLYVWLRRFESEEERERLYEAVYQSDHWKNNIGPRVGELIAREEQAGLYSGGLFDAFNARVATIGRELRARLAASRERTGRALAYGASVGCAALIHYFGLARQLDAVYDDTPLTDRLRTAEGGIPVLGGAGLAKEPPTDVAVLAWRYADAIAGRQQEFRRAGGHFYRALPDLAFVDA
jgi:hypothetical protein